VASGTHYAVCLDVGGSGSETGALAVLPLEKTGKQPGRWWGGRVVGGGICVCVVRA
jgi:hypothetical protein